MLEKSFGLFFFLKKPKNEKGNARYIYLRLTVDGISKDVATKRQWDCLRWNASAGRATGLKEDAKALNSYLDVMCSKVYQAKKMLMDADKALTAENLKNVLTGQGDEKRMILSAFKRLDPFSKKYARALEPTRKLEVFLTFLKSIDQWHKTEPIESVIGDKDNQIDKLKERITELESQLKEATKYDAAEKILIDKGGLPSFMDLIDQMQDLILPNDNKLTRSQTQSPWYKMIAKYFMHGDKEISIDTARNYFPAKKGDKPAKFIEIAEKDKLFKIIRKDNK